MTTELMRDFGIKAGELGNLSAVYFYAYITMQIPTGVLVDSWGARRLLIIGSVSAAGGAFLFAVTDNFVLACVARAIIGAATAVGWVVTLKLATHWFPQRRFAMIAGLGLLMGNVGALVAQVPLRLMVEQYGWRGVAFASGVAVLGIGGLAALIVKNDPSEKTFHSHAPAELRGNHHVGVWQLLKGFRRVFGYRNTWLIFLAQGGFVGAMLAFTGLWGPTYLKVRYSLQPTTAAGVCSVMIVCWAIASPVAGHLSDRIGSRKPIYLGGACISAAGWSTMFYLPSLPLTAFVLVAAVTSFASGAVILGFAFAKESVPVQFLGTISGAVNVGNMLGPTLLQPGTGWILDRTWAGTLVNGVRVYGLESFQAGFAPIVAWSILTALLVACTRDTHCAPSV